MISFKCECGAVVKVDDRFAGRLGRCPKCGNTVRIPGSNSESSRITNKPVSYEKDRPIDSAAKQRAEPNETVASSENLQSLASVVTGEHKTTTNLHKRGARHARSNRNSPMIIAGVAMLFTIFIPWMIIERPSFQAFGEESGKTTVVMSWDIIGEENVPGALVTFMIGSWVIGLTAVVLGACLSGLSLSVSKIGLAMVGIILFLILVGEASGLPGSSNTFLGSGRSVLTILSAIFLPILIIGIHLRLRLGASLSFRLLQGIPAGILAILTIIVFFLSISDYSDLPVVFRKKMTFDLVFLCLVQPAALAAYILSLVHAAHMKITSKTPSVASISIIYSVLAAVSLYLLIRPAVAAEELGLMLLFANIILLLGPIFFLFCSGAISAVCDFTKSPQASRFQAGVSATPISASTLAAMDSSVDAELDIESRLQQLETLKKHGLISEEEFAVKRANILDSI